MWGSTCCHICCLSVYSLTSKQRVGLYVLSRLLSSSPALRRCLLDGDISKLADSGLRGNGLRIVDTGLPGDAALNLPEDDMHKGRGFGFQIFPSEWEGGHHGDRLMGWTYIGCTV